MEQVTLIFLVVSSAYIASLSTRDKMSKKYIAYSVLCGIVFVLIGVLEILVFYDNSLLTEGLLLETMSVKFFFIFFGYFFVLYTIFALIRQVVIQLRGK